MVSFTYLKDRLMHAGYDASVGLFRQYRRTSVDLAKIEAAKYYLKVIQVMRKQTLASVLSVFGVIVFVNVVGVLQVSILLFAPWSEAGKIAAALFLGVAGAAFPLLFLLRFFSQEKWMKFSNAEEMTEEALRSNGHS